MVEDEDVSFPTMEPGEFLFALILGAIPALALLIWFIR